MIDNNWKGRLYRSAEYDSLPPTLGAARVKARVMAGEAALLEVEG